MTKSLKKLRPKNLKSKRKTKKNYKKRRGGGFFDGLFGPSAEDKAIKEKAELAEKAIKMNLKEALDMHFKGKAVFTEKEEADKYIEKLKTHPKYKGDKENKDKKVEKDYSEAATKILAAKKVELYFVHTDPKFYPDEVDILPYNKDEEEHTEAKNKIEKYIFENQEKNSNDFKKKVVNSIETTPEPTPQDDMNESPTDESPTEEPKEEEEKKEKDPMDLPPPPRE
tara:strand:- start:135 stop:809 length:675 start_codon:yes stop_codon:yes gene_type:complete